MKHTDAVTSTNGYQSHAEANVNGTRSDEGGGNILALICGSLCKDTPLAEMFGATPNDNMNNNNNAQPLMTPVQNGEQVAGAASCGCNSLVGLRLYSNALIFHGFTLWFYVCRFYSYNYHFALVVSTMMLILLVSRFSLTVTESQGFSKDICRSMVAMLDTDHSGKLGLEEFKSLLNDIAKWKVSSGQKLQFEFIVYWKLLRHFKVQIYFNSKPFSFFPRPSSSFTIASTPTSWMLMSCAKRCRPLVIIWIITSLTRWFTATDRRTRRLPSMTSSCAR